MLTRLEAESFRNLAPLSWEPGPGRHLLTGGNGAGKTSLLEAVYAVATTRSFRTPRLAECVRHGAAGFRLAAEVEDDARTSLAVTYSPEGSGLGREVNGARVPLAEHLEALPVVSWTSEDVAVVTGPPARRRRFLDRGVVSLRPGALGVLRRYRDALREKRELLARPRSATSSRGPADASLEAWNRVLAGAAVEVARLRSAYAGAVEEELRRVLGEAGLPFPPVTLAYRPSPAAARESEEEVFARLAGAATAERRRRIPLVGPHRDELEVGWGDRPASQVASAGERKALSLALAAAHGRVLGRAGRETVHLLDDLDAELAPDTLAALWRVFDGVRQLVATSNRPAVWDPLDIDHRWTVRDGRVERNSQPP
ncbi:MAG TPA: DNA replication and repair protein RecF [Thermoanaerobaculia bacterium]|nr:DNA replication and repair protein RecF [Thermoanaerobaculia bacterium]